FTPEALQQRTDDIFAHHAPRHEITWHGGGRPFLSPARALRRAVASAIEAETGAPPALSTGGGTSDGRYIAPTGAEVIELGPVRETIHKANEQVALADLVALERIYAAALKSLFAAAETVVHASD
ncbi:MAG: M20/M25/M40 family metallo-hydrolase, partial [Acetobacteraceae bacterium]